MSTTDQEEADCCTREGCTKECCLTCAACGIAGYCSDSHMHEDWKNHYDECNIATHDNVNGEVWVVETAEQEEDNGSYAWAPADMLHVKVAENGLVADSKLNVELVDAMEGYCVTHIEGMAAGEGFVAKDVFQRETKRPGVSPGEKKLGGRVTVTLGISSVGTEDPDVMINQPFTIEDVSYARRGGEGTTIFVNEQKMETIKADIRRNKVNEITALAGQGGMHVVAMRVDLPDGSTYTLNGSFSFAKGPSTARGKKDREAGFAAYAKGGVKQLRFRARRSAARAASSIRKLPQFVRITAHDIRGVEGSVVFGRSRKSGAAVYTVRSFAMHIPKGISGETNVRPLPSGRIETPVELSPVNAECLADVVALMDVLADHHDELQRSFLGSQQQPTSPEATKATMAIRTELNEVARIQSVLIEHANVLREEEAGTREMEDIPVAVNEAINKSQDLIALTLRERWNRMRNVREARKSVKNETDEQLKAKFLEYVERLQTARLAGQVGTQWLQMARALQEEILSPRRASLYKDPDVLNAMKQLQTMRASQGVVRKDKRANTRLTAQQEAKVRKAALEARRKAGDGTTFEASTNDVLAGTNQDVEDDTITTPPAITRYPILASGRRVI